jgi:hypothetical protein
MSGKERVTMNSKILSTSSDRPKTEPTQDDGALFPADESENRDSKQKKVKGRAPLSQRSEKDLFLKLGTAQTFASVGYFVRLNVSLSEPPLLSNWSGRFLDVTDVDVLALKHTIDFDTDIVCVSAKSGASKSLSPIRESFTLAGVMQYFGADRGYALFSERKIDAHMVSLAEQLNVALYDDAEWKHWKVRNAGTHAIPAQFDEKVDATLFDSLEKWSDMRPLFAYIRNEFWYYRDFRNIQNLIGITRKLAIKFSANPLGRFVFCDILSLFVISILQLCRFVSITGVNRIAESVPPYLFGGTSNYKSRRDLLKKIEDLLRSRALLGSEQAMPSLNPSYISDLVELVFRFCQKPGAAIRVPQYLSAEAGRAASQINSSAASSRSESDDSILEKFASDAAILFVRATGLSTDFISLSEPSGTDKSHKR